jgi:hypothetical protein
MVVVMNNGNECQRGNEAKEMVMARQKRRRRWYGDGMATAWRQQFWDL